jgi:hypothetical protein
MSAAEKPAHDPISTLDLTKMATVCAKQTLPTFGTINIAGNMNKEKRVGSSMLTRKASPRLHSTPGLAVEPKNANIGSPCSGVF